MVFNNTRTRAKTINKKIWHDKRDIVSFGMNTVYYMTTYPHLVNGSILLCYKQDYIF